ncbi:hypothetical protein FRUB_09284 [Fimbriiglobus ruber]|uniref:DUF6677 domain-containing protein n=2 Tax=Fimbriiglobus ruber TaxID=1908690 RepID=A0A225D547_9BACT|nr:hypothetical protein FRUB_09284 [Fimbriiglobus ruber]
MFARPTPRTPVEAPMTSPAPPSQPRPLDFLAATLSYLLPGLGQVLQGRIGKGVLFFVCLYGLFFYGMAMGQMKNVWLPDVSKEADADVPVVGKQLNGVPKALYYRPQFVGQFWIGIAAWPAIVQYATTEPPAERGDPPKPNGMLGHYMQALPEGDLNNLQRSEDKRWDLGWVYTVIAGVLNVLVIYDALAGPVIRDDQPAEAPPAKPAAASPPPPPPVPTPVTAEARS